MPSSGPSLLWKIQRAFDDLLHTPMLPPPPPPPTVEMADMDASPTPSSWRQPPALAISTTPSSASVLSISGGSGIESPASLNTSTASSIELDAGRAAEVREMIAAATRDVL